MGKMQMIKKMTDSIKADPTLDVSEWKSTLHFKAGALEKMELEDLNSIEIEGMPEPKEGKLTAVEMSVVAASQCYATTLHLQAYNEDIPLNEVTITFTGKYDRAPFLSIRKGNTGMYDSVIQVPMKSSRDLSLLEEVARRSIELSPVLSSLKEPVQLVIK